MTKTQYIKIEKYLENREIENWHPRNRRGFMGQDHYDRRFIIHTREWHLIKLIQFLEKNLIYFQKIERHLANRSMIEIWLSAPRKCCIEYMKEKQAEEDKVIRFG